MHLNLFVIYILNIYWRKVSLPLSLSFLSLLWNEHCKHVAFASPEQQRVFSDIMLIFLLEVIQDCDSVSFIYIYF